VHHDRYKELRRLIYARFRWAVCQLDSLRNCVSRGMLRRALKRLPQTLDETYERILCAIHEDHSTQAIRILRWLAFSCRPLYLDEVAEVVAVDPDDYCGLDMDEILEDPLSALDICASLVTTSYSNTAGLQWNGNDNTQKPGARRVLALAHYSVKEYLTSDRISKSLASVYALQENASNAIIARSCIGYLLQFQDAESFY
jgi:hypothetical protein